MQGVNMITFRIIAFFWLLSFCTKAQMAEFQFNTLDKRNGLSGNSVLCFLKDQTGFIWVGTSEGLNRYDGYTFKKYQHSQSDTLSIRASYVTALFEAPDGQIWVSAGDYLDVFDPKTDRFNHSQTLFNGKIQIPLVSKSYFKTDQNGNIWFGNSSLGLYKYAIQQDVLLKIPSQSGQSHHLVSDSITSLDIDSKGNIWIASKKGCIEMIDHQTGSVVKRVYLDINPDNNYNLYIDSDNDLWIYDKNNNIGIIFYNVTTEKITYFNKTTTQGKFLSDIVLSVIEGNDKFIWVGTDHGGIQIIDKKTKNIKTIRHNPLRNRSICSNTITSLYRDRDGFIWIGSFKNGFSYYHGNMFNFNLFQINHPDGSSVEINDIDNFAEDEHGNLWIGTNGGGLIYFNRQNNTFKHFKHNPDDPNSLSADIIVGMHYDSKGLLWIGTYFGGLNCYDGKKFIHYRNDPQNPMSLSDDRVWDVCEANNGLIWAGTLLGGVSVIDPKKQQVVAIYKGLQSPVRSFVIFDIAKGRLGELWFGTVDGLRMFNPENNQWTYYQHDTKDSNSLSHNFCYAVMEDSKGLIWIGTPEGLNMLDRSTGKFRVFTQADGLPTNHIITILEDNLHRIWLGSTNGLSVLEIENIKGVNQYQFTNFDEKDGLQSNVFNEKAAFKCKNGDLIFGGISGFNLFDPLQIKLKNLESKTVITDLQIFNQSISPNVPIDDEHIIDQTISYIQQITLKHQFNLFSLEFSNLNYFFPQSRRYQYILEGFQSEWLTTGSDKRQVTYTNLNPGKYVFRVRATNSDGKWSQHETALKIHILPPWWDTFLFKLAMGLLFLSFMLLIFYLRFYNMQKQKHKLELLVTDRTAKLQELNTVLLERQKEISQQNKKLAAHRNELEQIVEKRTSQLEAALIKAESADRLKSAFLANMSHEIRTPMNAIFGFAALLRDNEITPEENNRFIDIIQSSCDTLLVIINDILDISKIEANQLEINKRLTPINTIFNDLVNYYSLHDQSEVKIICDIDHLAEGSYVLTDPVRLHQIIVNLLNNALKFTSNGEIHYGYTISGHEIQCYVSDTGIGIEEKDYNTIFKEFNKLETSNVKFYKGAGLGLSISKRLTELLGGRIWVHSIPGKGTTFYFTIPYA